jgi:hypothetical protein
MKSAHLNMLALLLSTASLTAQTATASVQEQAVPLGRAYSGSSTTSSNITHSPATDNNFYRIKVTENN